MSVVGVAGKRTRSDGSPVSDAVWSKEANELDSALEAADLKTRRGDVKLNLLGIHYILTLHPYWRGTIRHNSMLRRDECGGEECSRVVVSRVRVWLAKAAGPVPSKDAVAESIHEIAASNTYHPVERYLSSLPPWDGVSRIDGLVAMLAPPEESTALSRAYMRAWMIGAVARVFDPGCQMDYMLVIFGKQGMHKTKFWRALAGGYPFYNGLAARHWTDPYRLHSSWIHEYGELESITTQKEIGEVKQHLTEISENLTLKYETQATIWHRRFVFAGTTNRDDFLRDSTGARRFWIIRSELETPLDVSAIERDRDQIWAEMVAAYRAGEKCYLTDPVLVAQHLGQGKEFAAIEDPWLRDVEEFLAGRVVTRLPVRTDEILDHIGIPKERRSLIEARRVGEILRLKGFKYQAVRLDSRVERRWKWPLAVVGSE